MVPNDLSNNVPEFSPDLIGTLQKSIFFGKALYKESFSLYNSVHLWT
jgi:hypothetical protein